MRRVLGVRLQGQRGRRLRDAWGAAHCVQMNTI
jgi:hypothetical protein